MAARTGFDLRSFLIHLTANFNLVLGGLAIAFGLYVLLAGADAMATMMQAGDAGAQAVGEVAPAGDAKKAGDILALAGKGIGGVFLAMASIVAGCMIAQGLPLVIVGLGLLGRQGWARVFGILFGLLGLLQGLACFGSPGGTRGVWISGAVFTIYGLLSLVALIGGRTSDYFARHDPDAEEDEQPAPSHHGRWALAGILCSTAIVGLACGIAFSSLPRTGGRPGPANASKQTEEKLLGVWETSGADAHRIAFAKDGVLYFASDKGASKGTYKLASADTLHMEYELPEAIFQAQKLAFDFAKKAADDPNNPFKGIFNAIEPVRVIKDKVRFTLADADKSLMLHNAKKPVPYKRSDTTLAAIEKQVNDQVALLKLPDKDKKVDPKTDPDKDKKVDPVDKLPKVDPSDAERLYRKRLAELHVVIAKGQASRLKEVIGRGAGVNDRDDKGETPLMKAVQAGYLDVVRELLNLGADWTVTDREGNDMFYHAIAIGRFEWLVVGLRNPNGPNLVYLTPKVSNLDWTEIMIAQKTIKRLNGYMVGAAAGQLSDLKYMHSMVGKAAFSAKDRDGMTALDHAQAKGHKEVVAWIEQVTGTKGGTTPVTKETKGGKWTASTDKKQVAFLKSCEAGDLEAIDVALRSAANLADKGERAGLLGARDTDGKMPLMLVAGRGDSALVLLLSKHIRESKQFSLLEATDGAQQTAFHHAAFNGDAEVVSHLLTTLMIAWKEYDYYRINWFRVLQLQDDTGKTALERSEGKTNKAAAKLLKDHYEANFATSTTMTWGESWSRTALEIACYDGEATIVRQLIETGCPLQRAKHTYDKTSGLYTPLMDAARRGHLVVVKTLLDSFGKDTAKKRQYLNLRAGVNNFTAMDMAHNANQPEVAALLKKHLEN